MLNKLRYVVSISTRLNVIAFQNGVKWRSNFFIEIKINGISRL